MGNNPLTFTDPTGLRREGDGRSIVRRIIEIVLVVLAVSLFGGRERRAHLSLDPSLTFFEAPGTIPTPTSFARGPAPIAQPALATPRLSQRHAPSPEAIFADDPPLDEEFGLLFDTAQVGVGVLALALSTAGFPPPDPIDALAAGVAINGGQGIARRAGRHIVLQRGTVLARAYGTAATESGPIGGFYMTQSGLRFIGRRFGLGSEILIEALRLNPAKNPATRLGLVEVTHNIPAILRPVKNGLVNEIVIRKGLRKYLSLIEDAIFRP